MVISRRRQGGDARTHNIPLTGIYKGIFVHGFINLETFMRTQNLAFVCTHTFKRKSTGSFIHEDPGIGCSLLGVGDIQVK